MQGWELQMATHYLEKTHAAAELRESQDQDKEFMHKVLDHLGSTCDTPDWQQRCLPQRAHRPPRQEWWDRLLPSPP